MKAAEVVGNKGRWAAAGRRQKKKKKLPLQTPRGAAEVTPRSATPLEKKETRQVQEDL